MYYQYFVRIFLLASMFLSLPLSAQTDTLILVTGDMIVGEVKKMDRSVLIAETEYSDSDFKIEWDKVTAIRTQSQFIITVKGGTKYYGRLFSLPDSTVQVLTMPFESIVIRLENIVHMEAYDDKFKDRFSASIDIGFDLAKARTLRTFSSTVKLGYHAIKWSTDASSNILRSTQDESDDIQRTETHLNFRYILPKRWYAIGTVSELSNTEQNLDVRMNAQMGLGRFIVRTNRLYWGAKLGFNRNLEVYSNETEDRQSWEGYMGTELNLYKMGDLDLAFMFMAYPGINEDGRWRSDTKLDMKYDLPLDFYLRLGVSFNFDNQPAEGASKTDYIIQTGFGWEW